MRLKYVISKDNKKNELMLQEFTEIDKGIFSLSIEETFDEKAIKQSASNGKASLIKATRTSSMFLIASSADKLADGIIEFFDNKGSESIEILYDDADLFERAKPAIVPADTADDAEVPEPAEIDDVLDSDSEISEILLDKIKEPKIDVDDH